MRKTVSWILLFAVYVGLVAPCVGLGQMIGKAIETKMSTVPPGLTFSLSEGQEGAEKRVKQPVVHTDPLSDAQSGDLLKRLPAIKTDPNDQTEFAKRIGSLPAPKTGNRIPVKFPSDEQRGTPKVDPG